MVSNADPLVEAAAGRAIVASCVLAGLVVTLWTMAAIPARASYGAQATADEPQYLLSALSLAEDRDLWIDDELAAERYRPFHEVRLPVQTEPLANGREVSPHDPLLPVLLAVPMGLGGWVAAKAALAVVAGVLTAALIWVAHRRFGVGLAVSTGTVLAFGLTAPLSAYATQVYPELPAALAVTVAVGAVTGPPRRSTVLVLGLAVVALPWLGVKYAPVAAALAAIGIARLVRARRPRLSVGLVVGLGIAALAYLVTHRLVYGGWTVYAAGDHFVGNELTVAGHNPNYLGRSRRVLGLLLDGSFGLAAWMPGYLLLVPAGAALLRRRPAGWLALAVPLAAGWATATWVALTMHGWWWPGRQVVVVLPCVVLGVAWWVERVRLARPVLAATALAGGLSWLWLLVETFQDKRTLIVDFYETANPLYRAWSSVLPDYWHPGSGDWVLQGVWVTALGIAAFLAFRAAASAPTSGAGRRQRTRSEVATPEMTAETAEIKTTTTRRPTHASA